MSAGNHSGLAIHALVVGQLWAGVYQLLTKKADGLGMIWSFCIAGDIAETNPPEGMVKASSEAEAMALIGHQDTNLYPLSDDVEWPDDEADGASVWWISR